MNLAPSWICRGPPNRAVDGALVGSRARTFGKKPVGHVILSGFAVSARAELPVQKLLIESTPKPEVKIDVMITRGFMFTPAKAAITGRTSSAICLIVSGSNYQGYCGEVNGI